MNSKNVNTNFTFIVFYQEDRNGLFFENRGNFFNSKAPRRMV